MKTWIIIGIIVLCLMIIGLLLFLLKKPSSIPLHTKIKNGTRFPYQTMLTITNTSSLTFSSLVCIDTLGHVYTQSTPFPPQSTLTLYMMDSNSLVCIGQTPTTQYVTVLGNVNAYTRFFYVNSTESTFSFVTTDQPATWLPQSNLYSTIASILPHGNGAQCVNGMSFPLLILLTNRSSDQVLLNGFSYNTLFTMQFDVSIFSNITNKSAVILPNELRIDSGNVSAPLSISLPCSGYLLFMGYIVAGTDTVYRTGFVLYNDQSTLQMIPLGNPVLEISQSISA